MEQLYDYYFHYNHFTGYWNAVKRDKSNEYLNGTLKEDEVIKHKNISDLVRFLSNMKVKTTTKTAIESFYDRK